MKIQLLLYAGNLLFLACNCWLLRLNKQYADMTGISGDSP